MHRVGGVGVSNVSARRARLSDPRLHIILSIGVVILSLMFDMVLLGISFNWILAVAICVILFSVYRIWHERRQVNSK
jgi:hypothetical protein